MAFVAILPTAGTILTGLGAAASSIPLIGGTLGAVGGGLGGAMTALGAGNIMGAASSLGSGILGAGSNLYLGADKLLGGFLPNLGGIGISPTAGFLGQGGLGMIGGPGQLMGPGGFMGPSTVATQGVPAMNGIMAPGVSPTGAGTVLANPAPNLAFQAGQNGLAAVTPPPSGFGSMLDGLKGGVSNIHGKMESAGVGKIFKGASMAQGLLDAYQGTAPQDMSHAQAANAGVAPRDAPGVQTIGASNAGAAGQVALAPRREAPNPFSPTATLSQQFTPSNPQGSADVDEKLQKVIEALGGQQADSNTSRAMELAESLARDAVR